MSSFQIEALRALQDITSRLQLQGYPITESGNGIEYKNYRNSTVLTVYHNRLDTENAGAIEIAVGCQNISEELSVPINLIEHWMAKLQQRYPTAEAKSPLWWPRVALKQFAHLDLFREDFRILYSAEPLAPANPETTDALKSLSHDVDERVLREIRLRRGQSAFRGALILAYGACAISGCADVEALEAAHITPHSSNEDYRTRNGLLLRADIHTLFDLRLISVNPCSGKIVVATSLGSTYRQYEGQSLRLPHDSEDHPDPKGLMNHFQAYREGRVPRADAS